VGGTAAGGTGMRLAGSRLLTSVALACAAAAALCACGGSRSGRPPSRPLPRRSGNHDRPAPERNVFEQKKRYQPLQEYLSAALGRPVHLQAPRQLPADLLRAPREAGRRRLLRQHERRDRPAQGGIEVLARPVDLQGVSTYTGVIFTRAGGPVTKDPATWKGRSIALVNRVDYRRVPLPPEPPAPLGLPRRPRVLLPRDAVHRQPRRGAARGLQGRGRPRRLQGHRLRRDGPPAAGDRGEHHRARGIRPGPLQRPRRAPDLDAALKTRLREALLRMHEVEDGQRALRQFGAQRASRPASGTTEPVFAMAREAGS